LGAWVAYWVIGDTWRGLTSLGWAKTQGVVIETGLKRSHSRSDWQYSLKVVYRYAVDGREYQNDRISFPERRGGGDEAYYQRQLDRKYLVGRPCSVYCNPGDPAQSCLEPGASVFFVVVIGFVTLLLLCGGVGCLAVGMRGLRQGRAAGGAPRRPRLHSAAGLWDPEIDGCP
jgi:hypothetical protein